MSEQEVSPQIDATAQQASHSLLHGPRQVGAYALPSGASVIHEVTADGMKQTKVYGSPYKSAAEFHVANGVATEAEMQRVAEDNAAAQAREEALRNARVIDPQQ